MVRDNPLSAAKASEPDAPELADPDSTAPSPLTTHKHAYSAFGS
jgi:hypothetical protein